MYMHALELAYRKLLGASQWPDHMILPNFKMMLQRFLNQVCELHKIFHALIAMVIGIDPLLLEGFFKDNQHSRLRLVKYA
jgi:isopenicillin N synthase-like dioxygenase